MIQIDSKRFETILTNIKRFWSILNDSGRFKPNLTDSKRSLPTKNDSDRFKTILTDSKWFRMILDELSNCVGIFPTTLISVEYVQSSNCVGICPTTLEFYKVLAWLRTFWLIGPLDSEASRGQKWPFATRYVPTPLSTVDKNSSKMSHYVILQCSPCTPFYPNF